MRIPLLVALLCMVLAVCVAGMTQEEIEAEIAACACVTSTSERLNCYDTLAMRLGASSALAETSSGKWLKTVSIDPLDDSKKVSLVLTAESGRSSWGDQVRLVIRCDSGELDVYIDWQDYLGGSGDYYHRVTWRIGVQAQVDDLWSYSTDHKAAFYRDDPDLDVHGFILQLMSADRFVAQTTPYMEDPITAVFDTTGLSNVVSELLEACGW